MSEFSQSCAVIIGIDAYASGIPHLTTAVNDATRLAEILKTEHGYEVILLTQEATKDRLTELFTDELPNQLKENARLLFYFAGHGIAIDGDDGPAGYLLPSDARANESSTFLAMTDLHAWLTALPCRHMLAILDCCFAGAFRWACTRQAGDLPTVIHKERYDRFIQSPAWQVITSASYDQKALDILTGNVANYVGTRKEDGHQHSPFAQALFDGLKGDCDLVPKGQGDGLITASELALYLRQVIEVEAAQQAHLEQTPQIWTLSNHRKGEFLFLVPGRPLNLPSAEALTEQNNPYRGLQSYDREHKELFFGREEETKDLLIKLQDQPFIAVLGASGTGKSSLVKAGLLPRLADAGPGWCVLPPIRPTAYPVQALAKILQGSLPGIPVALDVDRGLAQVVTTWTAANPAMRLVLTVDQCEELITLCRDEDERTLFLNLLATAIRWHPDVFRLIITLRTDFEPQLTQEVSPLAKLWQAARYVIPLMNQDALRDVIEKPASVCVLYFESPDLVDKLINEVVQMPGALPLLSFTLSEMYIRYVRSGRYDRALTQADYEALGGVIGSLRQRATEEYNTLPKDAHRTTMQRVMLRMISVEGGGELARRRVMESELVYPSPEENGRVKTVVDQLVNARLVVRGSVDALQDSHPPRLEASEGQPVENASETGSYVEPAHDALVTAWDLLLQWKREAEEYLPLQRRTTQAALDWIRAQGKEKARLLWNNNPRLPQLERYLALAGHAEKYATAWLNRCEQEFVQASVRLRKKARLRIVGITAAVIIALAVLAMVAFVQAGLARKSAAQAQAEVVVRTTAEAKAEAEARFSRSNELAMHAVNVLDTSPELALLLARRAFKTTYSVDGTVLMQANAALQRALASPFRRVFLDPKGASGEARIVAPDGSFFVVSDQDLKLYNSNNQEIGTLEGRDPYISPDSKTILTKDEPPDGQQGRHIRVYNVDSTLRYEFIIPQASLQLLLLSQDEQRLLVIGCPDPAGICDTTQVQVLTPDGGSLLTISSTTRAASHAAFNPANSQQIIVVMDATAGLIDVVTGDAHELVQDEAPVVAAAFSGDGSRVATVSEDGVIYLWDSAGNYLAKLPPVLSAANITLNRNGSRILVSTYPAGQVVTLLDATGQVLATTEGMFSDLHPSGTRFVTAEGYNTGQVSVWDDSGKQVARFLAHRNQVLSVGYTPDGRYLVTTGCDAEITFAMVCEAPSTRFWAFDDQLAADLINNGEETLSLHAAPDGEHLLTIECNHYFTELGSPDKCFPNTPHQRMGVVWDLKTGEEASLGMGGGYTIAAKFTAASDNVMLLECDPGTNFDSCIKPRLTYYNLDGQPTGQVADPHLAAISTGDFTPDGQHLLFLNANPGPGSSLSNGDQLAPLYLWNIEADQWIPTGSIQNHFTWVALSPDEQHFAAMDEDRREVSLWDLEGQLVITATLGKEDVDPRDVWGRFSPDGKWIVLGACTMVRMGHCDDATAFLWDLTTNQVNSFQAGTGRIASLEFSPDSQYLVIVNSNDKLVQLWSISDAETLRLRATLTGFTGAPLLSAFRHQGDRLLTAHADGSVWLWDLEGNTLGVIKAYGGSLSLAGFSGDGAKIIAVSCDAVSPETGSCAQERIRAWSLWQDPKEMLAEADTRLGARDFTVEECQSYLRSYDCP